MLEKEEGHTGKDDLDLVNLSGSIFSFFRQYGRLIAAFATVGMIAGFVLYMTTTKLYESTLLLHSSVFTNTEQINIIENWNAMLKGDEYTALGKRLNCSPAMLEKVVKISVAELQKLYIPNNPNGFVVTALVEDNSILDTLSRGIVYGLQNSDYIKAKLNSRRSNLTSLIDKVKTEIIKLDSTKRNIENSINSNSQHPSSFIIDASNINLQMIALNEKLFSYQEDLKFSEAVQVYHGFEKFQKPSSPKLVKSIVLGFIGGFFIGYITAVYKWLLKRFSIKTQAIAPTS